MNGYDTADSAVFQRLSALADPTRGRLLLVLERHELAVSELCAVLQLPQSTVSRHLKTLADDGWVTARVDGTSRYYRMPAPLAPQAAGLWDAVREQVSAAVGAAEDAERLRSVLAERRSRSREFFASAAEGEWDALKAEWFGERPELAALAGFLDAGWMVGDLGCGTGQLAASLAPFVRCVIAVDESEAMLGAAGARLSALGIDNVELRGGVLEQLPIENGELDAAVLSLVLHYAPEPADVLREVARTLRPGGRLLIVDMMPHEREGFRERMGHVWQGFSGGQIEGWLSEAGFAGARYVPLPADPRARGPRLFAATARKQETTVSSGQVPVRTGNW